MAVVVLAMGVVSGMVAVAPAVTEPLAVAELPGVDDGGAVCGVTMVMSAAGTH